MKTRRLAPVSLSVWFDVRNAAQRGRGQHTERGRTGGDLELRRNGGIPETSKGSLAGKSTSVGVTAPSRAMLDNGTFRRRSVDPNR